jgi:hypothetical protein
MAARWHGISIHANTMDSAGLEVSNIAAVNDAFE